jgi:putative Mg2+ transporter-C (MgtC) family protein
VELHGHTAGMHWPAYNLRADLCSPWLEIVLVLAAILSGAIIGTERERHDKPAGVRTLILISLGAAIFTMVSYSFVTTTGDSGRVAA